VLFEGSGPSPRSVCLGRFLDLNGEILDQVLLVFFERPDSYTGEDVVEISCHGSPVVAETIVEIFLANGLRLAEPGEFTLRAVLNGKMDLLQAEAVQDLIESKSDLQAQLAAGLLGGKLSKVLESTRESVLEIVCQLESSLEFVEDRLEVSSPEILLERLKAIDEDLEKLEESFREGKIARDGVATVLAGKPNVGKSSIFNSLCGHDGAIVTAVPGTTRDALKEVIILGGIPVTLIDTAGIRKEQDHTVEGLGVERSLSCLVEAELVLFVVDHSAAYDQEDHRVWHEIGDRPYLLVINKIDLPGVLKLPERVIAGSLASIRVSALEGKNLAKLKSEIEMQTFPATKDRIERPTLTRLRHKNCIEKARKELREGISIYRNHQGEELVLHTLRNSLKALGELTGEVTTEEILDQVFSSFCIGK
jgi:tRNA modification GTPase